MIMPCPRCGASAYLRRGTSWEKPYVVECVSPRCDQFGEGGDTEVQAILAWNGERFNELVNALTKKNA